MFFATFSLRDKMCGIREDGPAFDVIPVAVTVDHILHRNFEAFRELFLHPRGKGGVDGIGKDDSFRSHHEQREVIVVPRPVNIAFDIDDFASRRSRRLLGRDTAGEYSKSE